MTLNKSFSGLGKYIYFEASPVKAGEIAVLKSPVIYGISNMCMRFAYHMWGERGMGELKIIKEILHEGTKTEIFSNDISEDAWKEYEFTLPKDDYDYHVRKI